MTRHSLTLADGRRLAWLSFGPPDGRPILYCHGFPASGAEAAFTEEAAHAAGARVIAPDRPGFGVSDPAPGRSLTGWVEDALALLDRLDIAAAPVIGVSGGGPYALACAWRAPHRFPRVAMFGALDWLDRPGDERGMPPLSRFAVHLARRYPPAHAALFQLLTGLIRLAPTALFRLLSAGHCPADRAVFGNPVMRARWVRALRESVMQGAGGATAELRLYIAERPFRVADVAVPVELWHGLADTVVPARHGERLAAELPDCTAYFVPDGGHFSVPIDGMEAALATLLTPPLAPREPA